MALSLDFWGQDNQDCKYLPVHHWLPSYLLLALRHLPLPVAQGLNAESRTDNSIGKSTQEELYNSISYIEFCLESVRRP